jgi:GT2 family glycosyltransferase
VIVAPADNESVRLAASAFDCSLLPDPGSLAGAINLGATAVKPHHEFINWLNDDDLIEPDSLAVTMAALDKHKDAVVAYGSCRYIDPTGRELWVSKAGPWATRILGWGPDLIPQPGMLVRSSAWRQVGGLDESYELAFDLDLLLRLKRIGRLVDVGQIVSSFRWHPNSLTVGDRERNIKESERAKRAALRPTARKLAWMWEAPVRVATKVAAHEVQRRAKKNT